ncbi:MAG: hypothetical protein JWM05_925 [Acidimicrobiales bacterium]|nr:hypothetical protein [Acidimicrobiales bacterium]
MPGRGWVGLRIVGASLWAAGAFVAVVVLVGALVMGVGLVLLLALAGLGGDKPRFGDPGRGTRSQHLRVQVQPSTGLVERTPVLVTSDAFPNEGEIVGVTVCLSEADTAHRGSDACDMVSGTRYAVRDGHLRAVHRVPRVITVKGRAYDCASRPGRCLLVAASADSFDRSGGVALSFATDLAAPNLTAHTVRATSDLLPASRTPAGPVAAGRRVQVTVRGFQPGEPVLVAWCTAAFARIGPRACSPQSGSAAVYAIMIRSTVGITDHADAGGTFTTKARAPGWIVSYQDALDDRHDRSRTVCSARPRACSLVVAAAADTKRSAVVPLIVAS